MTCSTNHSSHAAFTFALVALFFVMCFTPAVAPLASDSGKNADTVSSRVVTSLPVKTLSRPQWARFSPTNPRLLLLDIDNRGYLALLPQGITREIGKGLLPIGWLGQIVVGRDQNGRFKFLDAETLTSPDKVTLGSVSLPWNFGKGRRLWFDLAYPKALTTVIPPVIPGSENESLTLTTSEEQSDVLVDPNSGHRNVIDATGKPVFQGEKRIYGITISPDTFKLVLYYGNTEHVLFNRLTGSTIELPTTIEAWTWLPDNSTLLGQVNVPVNARFEEVASTKLYVYELRSGNLKHIKLPPCLRKAALRILDVSTGGQFIVLAEQVVPESVYLGIMVLELVW